METKLMVLPPEVKELASQVSEKKQLEVQTVLNQIFSGTSKWEKQVNEIEVKDINDIMSIDLANVARKNAKDARLDAEKIFNLKRSEVQEQMRDYKLEDALWLKSKQIMQIKFKAIEENAKYKADFVKRHEEEQRELRTQLRLEKIQKFDPEISRIEIEFLSDEMFNIMFLGLEKKYNDEIEAEKQAEKERIERQRKEENYYERLKFIAPYSDFNPTFELLMETTEDKFQELLKDLIAQKKDYDIEQEKIRLENERLKKEAEKKEAQRIAKEKADKIKADRLKSIEEEKAAKLKAENEVKIKAEQQKAAKLAKELQDKKDEQIRKENERLAKIESEASKGDSEKVKDLISDLTELKTKYTFKSKKNQAILCDVSSLLEKIINHINK